MSWANLITLVIFKDENTYKCELPIENTHPIPLFCYVLSLTIGISKSDVSTESLQLYMLPVLKLTIGNSSLILALNQFSCKCYH